MLGLVLASELSEHFSRHVVSKQGASPTSLDSAPGTLQLCTKDHMCTEGCRGAEDAQFGWKERSYRSRRLSRMSTVSRMAIWGDQVSGGLQTEAKRKHQVSG